MFRKNSIRPVLFQAGSLISGLLSVKGRSSQPAQRSHPLLTDALVSFLQRWWNTLTVPGHSPSLWGSQGGRHVTAATSHAWSRAERSECIHAYYSASLLNSHSPGPRLREWFCPQWARTFCLNSTTKKIPHRHAHGPTWSRQSSLRLPCLAILSLVKCTSNTNHHTVHNSFCPLPIPTSCLFWHS